MKVLTKLAVNFTLLLLDSTLLILSDIANSAMRDLTAHVQTYTLACKLYYSRIMRTLIFVEDNLGKKVCIIHEKIWYFRFVTTCWQANLKLAC